MTPIESYESLKGSHVKIVVRRRSKDRIREQLSTAGGVRVIDLPRLGRVVAGAEHLEACHGRKLRMLAILGSCLASDLRVHAISGQVRDTLRKCLSVGVLSYTLLGLSGPMASGETQSQCPAVGGSEGNRTPNASVLCAALYMENGKVMVRGSPASVLYPSQSLERGRPVTAAKRARLEKDLLDQLAKALADAPGFYYFGLNDNERAKDDNHQLPAETKHPVDTYTIQVWNDQSGATYAEWADKVKGRLSFENALIKLVTHLRLDRQTGLSFPENGLDAEMGTLMLSVADLAPQIGDEQALTICIKDAMGQCGPSGDVLNRARLAQVLADFPGFTWRAAEIHDRLQQYYTNRGLSPQIEVSGSLEPRRIDITESGRIARILWSRNVDSKPVLQQEFLSILLSRKDFSFFSTHDLVADLEAVGQPTFRQLNYKINGSGTVSTGTKSINTLASPPPLYNLLSLQPQQAALESLGLIVTIRQGGSENSYDLIAQPKASDGATDRPQSAPSSPQIHSVESGTARASAQAGSRVGAAQPVTPVDAATPPSAAPKDQPNFLGFGIQYRPGQGVRPFGQFQRSRMDLGSAVASVSVQAGANGEALGSGSGRIDYLFFRQLQHRLSAEFNGGTNFTQRRILSGSLTDERRTDESVRGEYEVLGGNDNSQLMLTGEGRRTKVSLTPGTQPLNLNTAAIGAVFTLRNLISANPFRLQIEPSVRFGWTSNGDKEAFRLAIVRANLNQHLLDRVLTTLDVSVRLQVASSGSPLVEQPSLGGADVLRGFRTDDAIGRRLWSVQPELWCEFPPIFSNSRFGQFARKSLRLAGFVDVGGAYALTAPGSSGVRWGPGVGLRFLEGPIALKLDWAHGVGEGAFGRGRGRLYLGVSTASTF